MRFVLIVFSFFLFGQIAFAQEGEVYLDDLSFVYSVEGSTLKKFDEKGNELFVFSRMDLGKISYLDVSDPLRILVVYLDNALVAVLDNTLSEQRVIRLLNTDLGLPTYVASGANEQFWVYDALSKEVLLLDAQLEKQLSSGYLPALIGRDPEIVGLAERHEQVVIADATYGLWVLDRFGTLVHRHPLKGIWWMKTHATGVLIMTDMGPFWWSFRGSFPAEFKKTFPMSAPWDFHSGKLVSLRGKQPVIEFKN